MQALHKTTPPLRDSFRPAVIVPAYGYGHIIRHIYLDNISSFYTPQNSDVPTSTYIDQYKGDQVHVCLAMASFLALKALAEQQQTTIDFRDCEGLVFTNDFPEEMKRHPKSPSVQYKRPTPPQVV